MREDRSWPQGRCHVGAALGDVHRRGLGRPGARSAPEPRSTTCSSRRGGRTHWHTHERGQILLVVAGRGWVRRRDGEGGEIVAGDVVWIAPGEEHWHGADDESFLLHRAISLGVTDWLDPVTDADYGEGQA